MPSLSEYPAVERLVYWKKPLVSGLVLLIGCLVYLLCRFGSWSIISLLSSLCSVILVFGYLRKRACKAVLGNPISPESEPSEEIISPEAVISFAEGLTPLISWISHSVWKISTFQDEHLTLRAIGISVSMVIIGRIFSGLTIFFVAFFTVMTLPKIYATYPEQMAGIEEFVRQQFQRYVRHFLVYGKRYLTHAKLFAVDMLHKAKLDGPLQRIGILRANRMQQEQASAKEE
ncbi:hypothetical protein GEMRC1_011593 [Eukaryota sp. GEM-RC1]